MQQLFEKRSYCMWKIKEKRAMLILQFQLLLKDLWAGDGIVLNIQLFR